jgi:hypothetical protein
MVSVIASSEICSWVMMLPHRKNMLPHPNTLCSFRTFQCLLVHLNLEFLAKKQHIRMCLVFGFTRLWLEQHRSILCRNHSGSPGTALWSIWYSIWCKNHSCTSATDLWSIWYSTLCTSQSCSSGTYLMINVIDYLLFLKMFFFNNKSHLWRTYHF